MARSSGKQNKKSAVKLKVAKAKPLLAAIREWVSESERADSNFLGFSDAPAWVENALAEVARTVMPSRKLPTSGEWDLELLGELLGRQQAFTKMFTGEIPMSQENLDDSDRISKLAASIPQSPEMRARQKSSVRDVETMMKATSAAIPKFLQAAMKSSHADVLKFQRGLLRGLSLKTHELSVPKLFQRHTRTFWLLGTRWREFAACNSVSAVHRKLCAILGETQVGSLKTFQGRVAKRIGMKFRASGRPRKLI